MDLHFIQMPLVIVKDNTVKDLVIILFQIDRLQVAVIYPHGIPEQYHIGINDPVQRLLILYVSLMIIGYLLKVASPKLVLPGILCV